MKKFATAETMAAFAEKAPAPEEKPKEPKVFVPEVPAWIADKWAAVAVFGMHLVSKKAMNILGACFQAPEMDEIDHNCRMLLIRDDDEPAGSMGISAFVCKCIALNLQRIFEVSTEEIMQNPDYSILCGWHRSLLLTMLHEINHSMLCHSAGEVDEATETRRDEQADEWAWDKLVWMAKALDIEPVHYTEESFFGKAAMAWIETLEEPFKSKQKHMLENKTMMMIGDDIKTARFVHSFKQVVHSMSGEPLDSEEWKKGSASMADYIREMMSLQTATEQPPIPMNVMPIDEDEPFFVEETPPVTQQNIPMAHPTFTPTNGGQQHPALTPTNGGQLQFQPTAPATATAQTQNALPNHNLSEDVVAETVKGVIYKIYNHIFSECGWVTQSTVPFSNQEAVSKPIELTDLEKQVVFACDCQDAQGRKCLGTSTANGLRGFISTNIKLPMYVIHINADGVLLKRKIMPQNPANSNAAAKQAFDGAAIAIIMEGDDRVEAELKKTAKYGHWYFKIVNHEWIDLSVRR